MILSPSGNFSVCYNDSLLITCMTTEGPLLWVTGSLSRLFNSKQDPIMLGNLYLRVMSAEVAGNSISVTLTATLDRFTLTSSGLDVKCTETTTEIRKELFVTSGKCQNCCMCMGTGFGCHLANSLTKCVNP